MLSGTPTTTGTFNFTVTGKDNTGKTGSRNYAMVINATAPIFTEIGSPTVQRGNPTQNLKIAKVFDPDEPLTALKVNVNGGTSATVNGVTISDITVASNGDVTANIAACPPDSTTVSFTISVIDSGGLTNIVAANLTVTLLAYSPPVVTYSSAPDVYPGQEIDFAPLTKSQSVASIAKLSVSPNTFNRRHFRDYHGRSFHPKCESAGQLHSHVTCHRLLRFDG